MVSDEIRLSKLEQLRKNSMEAYGFGPNAMRRIRICTECGTPSEADKKNCLSCGAKLPQENLYQQYKRRHCFCSRCDTVVAARTQFCPQCGTRIQPKIPLKLYR